ncbi:MAG: hypothetical protein RSD57_16960 [Comamonas sp.]
MPLLTGDIRFARSANMADVPEGGGRPSAQLLTSGRSNDIFPDISEETRTVGRVEIYRIYGVLRNTDRDMLGGANVIIGEPPADPNVSITMLSLPSSFATRADIAKRIESGMATGSEWSGYLLENHFTTMRSIQLLQRVGMPPPVLGKTYVLAYKEGVAGERRQRVRIKTATPVTRTFTQIINNIAVDFEAQVTTCELFDALAYDFPGSPPIRTYAREVDKSVFRETVYSDSGMFYSASRLTVATQIYDTWLQVDSVYTQVVPNSKSEVASTNQRPSARRVITLADAPRKVEVGITPHTQRVKVDEVNVGLVWVFQCKPMPEPGTIFIDYWSLGQRYTLTDDGQGQLVGQGGGAASYMTGAVSVTLKAVPDIGSTICLSHGARVSYVNRSAQGAAVRAPEYAWVIEADSDNDRVVPGSLIIGYTSGGQVRTVVDDGKGNLTGDGTGVVDYPSRSVLLRPKYMPDAGAQLQIDCQTETLVTEILAAPTPDAAGFVSLTLAQQPAAGTLQVQWVTARQVSNTSGGTLTTTEASKDTDVTYTTRAVPEYYEPAQEATGGTAGGSPITWPQSTTKNG